VCKGGQQIDGDLYPLSNGHIISGRWGERLFRAARLPLWWARFWWPIRATAC